MTDNATQILYAPEVARQWLSLWKQDYRRAEGDPRQFGTGLDDGAFRHAEMWQHRVTDELVMVAHVDFDRVATLTDELMKRDLGRELEWYVDPNSWYAPCRAVRMVYTKKVHADEYRPRTKSEFRRLQKEARRQRELHREMREVIEFYDIDESDDDWR